MWKGTKPSAQPESYRNRRNRNHCRIFREKEERPPKAAVLGVKARSQFGFSLRQVKRRAVGFRHHGHRKTKNAISPSGKNLNANHTCCACCDCTMPIMLKVPVPV